MKDKRALEIWRLATSREALYRKLTRISYGYSIGSRAGLFELLDLGLVELGQFLHGRVYSPTASEIRARRSDAD